MVDIAKLDAALKYIDEHPEQWNQASWGYRWDCGTSFCLAGVVGVLDGARMEWSGVFKGEASLKFVNDLRPRLYACNALDLDDDRASELFHAENSRKTLGEMRDALAANPRASDGLLWEIADRNGNR